MDKENLRDYELDIIVKAWRDEKFRQALLKNPKKAIQSEFDIQVPEDVNIFVHEENEHNLHLIVPSPPEDFSMEELSEDELRDVVGGVMATGHFTHAPALRERVRLRNLEQENQEQKRLIEKLKNDVMKLERRK